MDEQWHVVYYARDPLEAELLKGFLASHGVAAQVTANGMVGGVGELPADAIETPLKVQADDFNRARELLQNYEQDDSEEINCPNCGEVNYANFELCWACGTALTSP